MTTRQKPARDREDRDPPHSDMAEQGVLGSIMVSNGAAISQARKAGVESAWLFVPAHATIFQQLCDAHDAGQPIGLSEFTERLRGKNLLAQVGGDGFITELFRVVPTAANIDYYIGIVRDYYIVRESIRAADNVNRLARNLRPENEGNSPLPLLDEMESRVASLRSLQGRNGVQPISWEELSMPPDLTDSLLENRALERGQGVILFGPAGCGKSVAGFQMCACWSAGIAGIHIAPPRPLRIVILQTEDSQNDLREYCDGIFSQECFTAERIALVKQNLLVMPPVPGGSPEDLRRLLIDVADRFRPDLISLNPLLAFCAADYTRELGAMLYQVIDPIIKKYHAGFLGVHHTTKPIYKDTSGFGPYDYQYLAAGDARIANWPRLSIQIEPIATNPSLTACFRITKRWQRVAWLNENGEPTRERYLKHSTKIWWEDASQDEEESARADEQPREILEILPSPTEPGIIREEVRVRAKNKLHVGKGKADDWLKIGVQDGLVERYESSAKGKRKTKPKRKIALFRRVYE
jgi:hypothetical protein